MICSVGINSRFVSLIGGPCTVGPGKVVDIPLKKTIRVYFDIIENNENAQHLKAATKFYDDLEKTVSSNKCTMDIWAYGVDQFGLLEMKNLCNHTGGLLAMHEEFSHYIFKESFERFYSANEAGMFNFPFATTLKIRICKEMKLNGILGLAKSMK